MSVPRVVLDSNVIISAFLFGGGPRRVLSHAMDGRVQCIISLALLDEVRDVLLRPKFGLTPDQVLIIIEELQELCRIVTPNQRVRVVKADPDDNKVIECALAGDAHFIISGDAHLLDLGPWQNIAILSPADFLDRMGFSPDGTAQRRCRPSPAST